MRRVFLILAVVALASSVSAQQTTFNVLGISPASGPITGGSDVVIRIDRFPCSEPPTPSAVLFDGIPGTNLVETHSLVADLPNTIAVTTPPHAAGPVDVVVQTCSATVTVARGFTYESQGTNTADYERVLFPVVFQGPGAFGSDWRTQISVFNNGPAVVDAANKVFEGDPTCPAVCGCDANDSVRRFQTAHLCVGGFQDPMGLIYYPRKRFVEDLSFGSRIFDVSRSTLNAGTEIPVVRERDFHFDVITLVDVPLTEGFRVALRAYDPDQHDGAQLQMTIVDPVTGSTIGERTLMLSYPIRTAIPDPFPNRPAFVFVNDLQDMVRSMLPAGSSVQRFNIHLTPRPVTSGVRFWAFASVTNNVTQVVTTVSPQ